MDYNGSFEMEGDLNIGDQLRKTHVTFRKIKDYEAFINAVYLHYDSEDANFNGYIYKIDKPHFSFY